MQPGMSYSRGGMTTLLHLVSSGSKLDNTLVDLDNAILGTLVLFQGFSRSSNTEVFEI